MAELHHLRNPIIPGFYPDPSCIRVLDTFYLINSSFQYFPGLPIHRSIDLVNWELIGHAICRPDQLSLTNATTKFHSAERGEIFTAGLYAPTIRYHNGTFYIVCTNLTGRPDMPLLEDFQPHNFIITAKDLTDPASFSKPVYFDFHGIDPSLFFDDNGKVYVQGSWIHGYRKQPATVIRQAEVNPMTGGYRSLLRDIWAGSGDKVPEGPHMYKKDGYYYLLIAEGGTHRGHKVTMARSMSPWGPFESFEGNPVLTKYLDTSTIQCVGHAELFDDALGNWWACMLARREYGKNYPLGRETYLVPVTWKEGQFPEFPPVELKQNVPLSRPALPTVESQSDVFVTPTAPTSVYLRTPELGDYAMEPDNKILCLRARQVPLGTPTDSPTFIGARQISLSSVAEVVLDLISLPIESRCGLALYKDTFRHASLDVDTRSQQLSLTLFYPLQEYADTCPQPIGGAEAVNLRINSTVDEYSFHAEFLRNGEWSETVTLGTISCAAMSGDDFTGTVYGVYACGDPGIAKFRNFHVASLDDEE